MWPFSPRQTRRTPATRRRPAHRPLLEILEDRLVLSGSPPAVLISGPAQVGESPYGPYTLNLTAVDPENDPVTQWTIDWGDGSVETLPGNPSLATHDYANGPVVRNITASAVVGGETFDASVSAPMASMDPANQPFLYDPGQGMGQFVFGPDMTGDSVGDIYAIRSNDHVAVFDGASRALVRTLITSADGLRLPRCLILSPDGNQLYVAGQQSDNVFRYDFATASLSEYIHPGTGLYWSQALAFGPDGNLYVTRRALVDPPTVLEILRYNETTASLEIFISNVPSTGSLLNMEFRDGYLYALIAEKGLYRYAATDGTPDPTTFLPNNTGHLWHGFTFGPDGDLYVSDWDAHTVLRFDPDTRAPLETITGGGLTNPYEIVFGPDANGDSRPEMYVGGFWSYAIHRYTGPLTATAATSLPVTVLDIQTKFYVPDDGAGNLTYEYDIGSTLVESYALSSGNTAPRGAASTAAGDKVWVVDANKKVYVYNAAGALLASWTLGSLSGSAQVEDIATNGTDIWIVDAKQDKVFRYAGAASRISGSQNAASSFSLNSGNKNPKGIVTDGTSLWVVDDAGTDKVFKYTLTGSLLGSWTITAGGGSPTGITLDPSALAHLWIVDSGTDRVYQYDDAAGHTSGSHSASDSFALAAGNANPQGIADPPGIASVMRPSHKVRRRGNHSDRGLKRDPADELGGRNHDLGRRAAD